MKKLTTLLKTILVGSLLSTSAFAMDKVIATVDGNPILISTLTPYLQGQKLTEANKKQALELAIEDILAKKLIQTTGVQLAPQEIQAELMKVFQRTGLTESQFIQALQMQGVDPKQYMMNLQKNLITQKAMQSYIFSKVKVLPSVAKELAQKMKQNDENNGTAPDIKVDEYQVSHILLKTNPVFNNQDAYQELLKIKSDIEDNKISFKDAALKYSKDFASLGDDGSLGWNVPQAYDPVFAQMMVTTPLNEISKPFQTNFGWHILKVTDTRKKDVSDNYYLNIAQQQLANEQIQVISQGLMKDLRSQAQIEYLP